MTDVKYISGHPICDVTARAALAEKADADEIGDLSQLATTAKDNLVAAINEAIADAEATEDAVNGLNERLTQQITGYILCESGSYNDSNGAVKISNSARIRNATPVAVGGYSGLTIPEGYQAWVFRLDKNRNHISAVGSWLSGNIAFNAVLTSDTCFINFAIKNTATSTANISAEIETVQNGLILIPLLTASESEAVKNLNNIFSVNWIDGIYINASGAVISNASFVATDYIELSDVLYGMGYSLYLSTDANIVSFYTKDKIYISGVRGLGNNVEASGNIEYPSEQDAKYVRFSHCKVSSGKRNPSPIVRLNNVVEDTYLAADSVTNKTIQDGSVSRDKTDFIIHNPETNYIKKDKYSDGYINASGVFIPNSGWKATDYVSLSPNTKYYSAGLHGGYCAFYKADMSVIAAYGAYAYTVTEFTTPSETAYGRFSLNASSQTVEDAWINIKNEKPEDYGYVLNGVGVIENENNPCNHDGKEIAVFNKILCVGDSMTEGTFNHLDSGSTQWVSYAKYSYPTYLHKMTGVDVTNLGHGGQTSVQWYNTEKDTDLSGYDCAIIQLGINDFGTYGELGADTKTAFQNIINKLKTENNNIKIFVANIIPAISYSSAGYKAYSTALLEWLETEYTTDKNVVPVDIQRYGHTGDSSAFNAGHLTALGYRMLARDYIGFISDYIKNNGEVFREVQFIGTDYWYVNPNS